MSIQISIIIATYNAASTLTKCLEGIVNQLNDETELIIIDGGSRDSTCDIINSYRQYIDYTISEKDNGVYDAWNKGIRVARGKWIAFIGADDVLLPNAIEIYMNLIHHKKDIDTYDYICAHVEYIDTSGRILNIWGNEPKWNKMKKGMAPAHVASLHNKKNLFEEIGVYDYVHFPICADYELLLRKRECLKYIFLPNNIARMQKGGMSFSVNAIRETYNIRKKHKSISIMYNLFLYLRDVVLFKTYNVRHSIKMTFRGEL
ncbi:MAG: glycosyltransferase [Bacteroidales bacterium]|jgi:glycosyltransferase involved in cell wall biosynthesis|nr:glycosyltransferase [Bacteroidales bacterium]